MKTKNQIVDRLYKAGHITLEEVLVLMEKEVKYVPKTNPFTMPWSNPIQPLNPLPEYTGTPWWIINSSSDTLNIEENSCLSGPDINEGLVKYK